MHELDHEQLYLQHKKAIEYICRKFAAGTSIELDELVSDANLVFSACCMKYDPERGDFNRFLSSAIYYYFFSKIRKMKHTKRYMSYESLSEVAYVDADPVGAIVDNTFENLSKDSRDVCELIFSIRDERIDEAGSEKEFLKKYQRKKFITRNEVYKKLRYEYGWSTLRVNRTFNELSQAF